MTDGTHGYYRSPTIHGDRVVFMCENDLWEVGVDGGVARRLTANRADAAVPMLAMGPRISPDGSKVAFVGQEEGAPEVWVMPTEGGPARRLTFLNSMFCVVAGWSRDGKDVLFAGNCRRPFRGDRRLWRVPADGGPPEMLEQYGQADRLALGPDDAVVIGRNIGDPARWKRYKGGTAGDLWVDRKGEGQFKRLLDLKGNVADPMWIDGRIWFLSDHEGWANLYSVTPTGRSLKRHTHHEEFYARNASTDGKRVVYQRAGELWLYDPEDDEPRRLDVQVRSARPSTQRRFAAATDYLETVDLHPKGHSLALTARGQVFTMGNWERAARRHGSPDGVRRRLARWLHDGKRVVCVSDAGGEEALEIHAAEGDDDIRRLDGLDVGRAIELEVSPTAAKVALTNHRYELVVVDLEAGRSRVVDRSEYQRIHGVSWSPDGKWLAYGYQDGPHGGHIRVAPSGGRGKPRPVTRTVCMDVSPAWDPDGRLLHFIGRRVFNPVYDSLHFDLGFPRGSRPYVITLRADDPSPFDPAPRSLHDDGDGGDDDDDGDKSGSTMAGVRRETRAWDGPAHARKKKGKKSRKKKKGSRKSKSGAKGDKKKDGPPEVRIDFDGIQDRVLPYPVQEAIYERIQPAAGGRVFYSWSPVSGSLDKDWLSGPGADSGLMVYDMKAERERTFVDGITDWRIGMDGRTLVYDSEGSIRVLTTERKPENDGDSIGRHTGWVDTDRPTLAVRPHEEWRQMFREAWRLQRDHFWNEDMSGVDWVEVHDRWQSVLDRLATRDELSDVLWEMQGELGTSHAYEFGGDRTAPPRWTAGLLGADLSWGRRGWVLDHVARGDSFIRGADSPLNAPGVALEEGDVLVAVDGLELDKDTHPCELLVNRAGSPTSVTVRRKGARKTEEVVITPLRSEMPVRYREWVEANRRRVHEETDDRVGYVHVPDMGPAGFSEFHRYWLQECGREGLIVDVRFNGGGHVSQLLLEKLARRTLGFDVSRWGRPDTYPSYTVLGPMVALTNEFAGSDGDIFSHAWKLMDLGPLVGKRTWGGVVGIWPRHPLVDQTVTTQAEFAFWFEDVGFGVENFGTEPSHEVDIAPQDYAAGRDPQMDKALDLVRKALDKDSPDIPDFGPVPSLTAPRLPGRQTPPGGHREGRRKGR